MTWSQAGPHRPRRAPAARRAARRRATRQGEAEAPGSRTRAQPDRAGRASRRASTSRASRRSKSASTWARLHPNSAKFRIRWAGRAATPTLATLARRPWSTIRITLIGTHAAGPTRPAVATRCSPSDAVQTARDRPSARRARSAAGSISSFSRPRSGRAARAAVAGATLVSCAAGAAGAAGAVERLLFRQSELTAAAAAESCFVGLILPR